MNKKHANIAADANEAERKYLAAIDRKAVRMIEHFIRASEARAEKWRRWVIANQDCRKENS